MQHMQEQNLSQVQHIFIFDSCVSSPDICFSDFTALDKGTNKHWNKKVYNMELRLHMRCYSRAQEQNNVKNSPPEYLKS